MSNILNMSIEEMHASLKEKKIKEKGALTVLSNIGKIFTRHKIISNGKKTYRFVSLLEYPLVSLVLVSVF